MSRVHPGRRRDLLELILGYGAIVGVIWTPEHLQRILSPIALVLTLVVVLARGRSRDKLGVGTRGLIESLWILAAAIALTIDADRPLQDGELAGHWLLNTDHSPRTTVPTTNPRWHA